MNIDEGGMAVRTARDAVETITRDQEPLELHLPGLFMEPRGVFVTLKTFPARELRGCIGYPEPIMSLGKALIKAAEGACHDPRFPPLRVEELDHIIVEVSVLTPPEELDVEDRRTLSELVEVGRDGLIMEMGPFRGLLLPQVPVEWRWDAKTFLCQTCIKAGMSPDCWLERTTTVYRFSAEVFAEDEPRGETVPKPLE